MLLFNNTVQLQQEDYAQETTQIIITVCVGIVDHINDLVSHDRQYFDIVFVHVFQDTL